MTKFSTVRMVQFSPHSVDGGGKSRELPVEKIHLARLQADYPKEPAKLRSAILGPVPKVRKRNPDLSIRHARESGHPEASDFPGFRLAPRFRGGWPE